MEANALFLDPQLNVHTLPTNVGLVIDSHGSKIYGRMLLPAFRDETGTCPVVLMLHGYPGIEQNIDLAQLLRMGGYAVVHFSYRGVWGSHGQYCFTHLMEDTEVIAGYIRENAEKHRIDPERLYLFGHSMGGFAAINAIARGLKVAGAVLMAPCDIANKYLNGKSTFDSLMQSQDHGYFCTSGRDALENEVRAHAEQWRFTILAEKLDHTIPYCFIGGTRDTVTPPNTDIYPIMEALNRCGAKVEYLELCDGHAFPASRMRLATYIADCLKKMDLQQSIRKADDNNEI